MRVIVYATLVSVAKVLLSSEPPSKECRRDEHKGENAFQMAPMTLFRCISLQVHELAGLL